MMEIIKYAILDAITDKHIVSVEADSSYAAIERFNLVRGLVAHYKEVGDYLAVTEHDSAIHTTEAVFTEGFFTIIEILGLPNQQYH